MDRFDAGSGPDHTLWQIFGELAGDGSHPLSGQSNIALSKDAQNVFEHIAGCLNRRIKADAAEKWLKNRSIIFSLIL
jgi:uncharacterized protein (DUF1810 family)